MNILQGIKATNPKTSNSAIGLPQNVSSTQTKFIIKSKPSVNRQNQQTLSSQQQIATTQDVHQLITYFITKSKRFKQLLQVKEIINQQAEEQFNQKHLYHNPCMRTILKSLLDKMLTQRRIGKNLKGIGKGILQEVQNYIWSALQRQTALYQVNKMFNKQTDDLKAELATRKQNIQRQIQLLTTGIQKQIVQEDKNKNKDDDNDNDNKDQGLSSQQESNEHFID